MYKQPDVEKALIRLRGLLHIKDGNHEAVRHASGWGMRLPDYLPELKREISKLEYHYKNLREAKEVLMRIWKLAPEPGVADKGAVPVDKDSDEGLGTKETAASGG